MKRIAFFDFDGTITTKDTLLENIKFHKGSLWFYFGFLLNAPYLVAFKAKIISNQMAKEKVLKFFFGGNDEISFQKKCDDFATAKLPEMIRPKAVHEIKKHLEQGTEVVIVSASASNWFRKWANEHNLQMISTTLEVHNNKVTGKIAGNNCYGEEKVALINQRYNLKEYDEIYCYGDTSGDKPMLALGTRTFYKPFR
jgi:HAD superfamily hydrolase (TIGR01490 family)